MHVAFATTIIWATTTNWKFQ